MEVSNKLDITGMHCANCAIRIEKTVSKMSGVTEINVNLTTGTGRVTFNQNRTSISNIIHRINEIGFKAGSVMQHNSQSNREKEISILKWKFISSALLTVPLAWAMFAHFNWASFLYIPELFINPLFQMAITIPIQFIIGFSFYEGAWKSLKSGSANMDVLVVLSTSAAFFYSHYLTMMSRHAENVILYFETSAFIITFILLGKLLEANTKLRTTEAIKGLYKLQAATAIMDVDGKEIKSAVDKLMPGDVIILKPGEKVPIDGQVIKGNTMINESLLTGESIPVEKRLGYPVYAGTMNQNGILKIQVTKRESETVLSQIILTVEEAQASKAPIQQVADRVTGVFVPIIIMIALATFGVWYIFLQAGVFSESLEKMIAVLIVACPCALGLATPTSIMVGSGRAAQLGILFKEGKSLEALGKGKTVIFDKTGTITKGVPQVTNMYTFGISEEVFLKVVGAVEINLKHPLAQAVTNEVKKKIRAFPTADDVLSISGYGVKASVNGRGVTIASPSYFSKNNGSIPLQADQLVTTLEREGKTVMIVFIDKQFAGVIAVADGLKDSSIVAISRLKQMGINVVMLTGDNRHSAKSIAKKVGISKFKAGVTPQDKANIIKQLQQNENSVIMVGDGMNDAPALAVANVGVAVGTGSDVAIESGDVTIIRGDLKRFVDAMMISKKTMRNIKQNLFWAFFYNILMIPLAMFGVVAPWLAGAAMAFSSVSVIFNALRLKRVKV